MVPAESPDISAVLSVTVAYSGAPRQLDVVELKLAAGATAALAIAQSGLLTKHTDIDLRVQKIGVWGRLCEPDQALRDLDRVEIYRPLQVDPKEARRLRYKRDRVIPSAKSSRQR
jgi:uncharacterized protein